MPIHFTVVKNAFINGPSQLVTKFRKMLVHLVDWCWHCGSTNVFKPDFASSCPVLLSFYITTFFCLI